MEFHMCGFNAHHQVVQSSNDDIFKFKNILRSPYVHVQCALWSSTVLENDGDLLHKGFRPRGTEDIIIEGPPTRNIKTIFGDTSGALGALTTDGSLYVLREREITKHGLELKKHHFDEGSFIHSQNLAIDHIAVAESGEVCAITNSGARGRASSGCTPIKTEFTPKLTVSAPTSRLEMHTFASFASLINSESPTFTVPIFASIISLHASATSFAALTGIGEVLTFGSALHAQVLGRTPTPSDPAHIPASVPFLGGIPIRKVAVGGWLAAAVSEDNDLYIWGGQASEARRINALPKASDGDEVKLVDIDGGVDIVDVGVGSGHVIALTSRGDLWVIGDGGYGQLGTCRRSFEEDWVKIKGDWLRRRLRRARHWLRRRITSLRNRINRQEQEAQATEEQPQQEQEEDSPHSSTFEETFEETRDQIHLWIDNEVPMHISAQAIRAAAAGTAGEINIA
ncbi:hypothetical protein ACLMJK_005466 [Lecanora helva]